MLLYDKKQDSIDIYTMKEKKEQLKEFRKKILQEYQEKTLFYLLKTNSEKTMNHFLTSHNIDMKELYYIHGSTLRIDHYSKIEPMEISKEEEQRKQQLLKRYVNGEFDSVIPTRVFYYLWEENDECECYQMLNLGESKNISSDSYQTTFELDYIMNLPRKLYLLHLLKLGLYDRIGFQNMKEQLELFDIHYLTNISFRELFLYPEGNAILEKSNDTSHLIKQYINS